MKMNPEWKTKWLEALRSGKYKQGKGRLRNKSNGFCCLGVLVDVVDPTIWKKNPWQEWQCRSSGHAYILPDFIEELTGIDTSQQANWNDVLASLPQLNDDEGLDFNQIADVIEANF